jgi:hypothetical protein
MGRLPKAVQQAVSLERVNPNAAFTGTPDMLASIANSADRLAGNLMQKKREYAAVEEQKQQALNTIKMNRAGVDMSREMTDLHNKVTTEHQDNPTAGEEAYKKGAEEIKAKYENNFADDSTVLAQFSGVSSGVMRNFDTRVSSWKSSQEIINATGDYTNSQDGIVELAGNAPNLSELYKHLNTIKANGETAGPWLMKDGKDVAENIKNYQKTAVKNFLYGQLDAAPEKVEEYLKDPNIEHRLDESESLDLKRQAKAEMSARKAEAETADIITFVEDYYNMRAQAREGNLSIRDINNKIEAAKASGASKGRLEMLYQLRDSMHKDLIDERNAAVKEDQRLIKEEDKTNAFIDVITSYNNLFNKKGQLADDKTSLEEVVELQSKITDYQKQGLLGDMSDFEKRIIAATQNRLSKSSTVYKKRKVTNPDNNWMSALNPFDDKEVPIDDFNAGIKGIVEWADKDYSGASPTVHNSVKSLAVSDYIRNYQKYKQQGLSDSEIITKVKTEAQRLQRVRTQEKVDAVYFGRDIYSYSGKHIPALSKELGVNFKVTSTYRPGDTGMHGQKKAVDVSMSEHTLANKIKFFKKELNNPNIKTLGTSDPALLSQFAGNPKLKDLRNYDKQHGGNHVNHVHITMNAGVNEKPAVNKTHKFNTVAQAEAAKLPKGTLVYIGGRKAVIE